MDVVKIESDKADKEADKVCMVEGREDQLHTTRNAAWVTKDQLTTLSLSKSR